MLSKNDLKQIKSLVKSLLKDYAKKKDLTGLARSQEIDNLEITFTDNLRQWKDELYNKIDKVLGQLKSAEQEKVILEARQDERQKLELRIEKLEKIHPQSSHSFK